MTLNRKLFNKSFKSNQYMKLIYLDYVCVLNQFNNFGTITQWYLIPQLDWTQGTEAISQTTNYDYRVMTDRFSDANSQSWVNRENLSSTTGSENINSSCHIFSQYVNKY